MTGGGQRVTMCASFVDWRLICGDVLTCGDLVVLGQSV